MQTQKACCALGLFKAILFSLFWKMKLMEEMEKRVETNLSILYVQHFGIISLRERAKGSERTSIQQTPCLQIYFSVPLLLNAEVISGIHS